MQGKKRNNLGLRLWENIQKERKTKKVLREKAGKYSRRLVQ